MDPNHHLKSLLFDSQCSGDYDDAGTCRPYDQDNLLEEESMQGRNFMQHLPGRIPASESFLKTRGEKTERLFFAQNESKLKFAQAIGPSVEFSHSELSHSNLGKDRSPGKAAFYLEEEIKRRDVRIQFLEHELDRKEQAQESVDRVLSIELGDLERQHQSSNRRITELEAQVRGYKKKIELLENEKSELRKEITARSDKQLHLQKKLSEHADNNDQLATLVEQKDLVFQELKREMDEAADRIADLQGTVESLRLENRNLKEQFEVWNITERNIRNLNVEQPSRLNEVASKRSLTNIYDRNGTELKKQYSTKTLLDETPSRMRDERIRNELEQAKRKIVYFEEGFLETKRQAEKLQLANDELQRIGANQQAEIDKLRSQLKNREVYIGELSKTLEKDKRTGRDRSDKQISTANQTIGELKDKLTEYEKRFQAQKEKLLEKEDKIKQLLLELTSKSKSVQDNDRVISDLRSLLDLESSKMKEAQKEVTLLTGQLKEQREKIRSLERTLEEKTKGRKEQDRIEQLKKDVIRLEKEAEQRETGLKETKKKLEQANKKFGMGRNRITELEQLLATAKTQMASERQNYKKMASQLSELKKKAADAEILSNKVKILEAQVRSHKQQSIDNAKEEFDINDRVEALEEILQVKEREIEQLRQLLDEKEEQADQSNNENARQTHSEQPSHLNEQMERLLEELQQRQAIIEQLNRQLEFKEKSLEFLHNKLLKVEREKLEIEAEAKIFQSNLYESIDSQYVSENQMDSYNTKLTLRRDKLEQFEMKMRSLEDVNRQLEEKNRQLEDRLKDEINDKKKSTASLHQNPNKQSLPTSHSTEIRDSCSNKIEVLVLKNRVKQLTEMLNKVYNESSNRKLPPESLSPDETLEFLLETMRRVNRSSEMIRLLSKSTEFIELMRHIDRRKDQVNHTRRLYA